MEKSVLRVAVLHHGACRVMTNCYPEGVIFLFYPHNKKRIIFLAHHFFID